MVKILNSDPAVACSVDGMNNIINLAEVQVYDLNNNLSNMDISYKINLLNDMVEYTDANEDINKILSNFHYKMVVINDSREYVKLLSKMINRIKKLDDSKDRNELLKEFENEYGEHLVNYCSYYLD